MGAAVKEALNRHGAPNTNAATACRMEKILEFQLLDTLIMALVIFLGALIQGAMGFGLGIIAAPFLIMINPELIPGLILFVALPLASLTVWRDIAGLAIGELLWAVVGRIPGTLLGLGFLAFASTRLLSVLLGICVLLAVLLSARQPRIKRTHPRLFSAGVLSAFMATTTSVGGPPMALLYQSAEGREVRANLAAYMIIGTLGSLIALVFVGRFTLEHAGVSTLMLFPTFLGFLLARTVLPLIDPTWFRPGLLVLCSGAGITALVHGLVG